MGCLGALDAGRNGGFGDRYVGWRCNSSGVVFNAAAALAMRIPRLLPERQELKRCARRTWSPWRRISWRSWERGSCSRSRSLALGGAGGELREADH